MLRKQLRNMGTNCTRDIKIWKFYCYVIQGLSMTRRENVMGGTYRYIPPDDETFLKYFRRDTGNTDHFVDAVAEKGN